MSVEIVEIGPGELARFAQIPTFVRVESVFRVEDIDGGLGGFRLTEERVAQPRVVDEPCQRKPRQRGEQRRGEDGPAGEILAEEQVQQQRDQ